MCSQWSDVDVLIKELQKIDGVQSVNKGRFFLSPGLAPTFQVRLRYQFCFSQVYDLLWFYSV